MILWEWKTRKNATVWNIRFRLIRTIFDNFIFEFPEERVCVCVCVCPRALVCLFCYSNAFILLYLSLKKTFFCSFFLLVVEKKSGKLLSQTLALFTFFLATKFWDKAREEEEEENSLLWYPHRVYNSLFTIWSLHQGVCTKNLLAWLNNGLEIGSFNFLCEKEKKKNHLLSTFQN